jgi:hypothetical protein
VGEARERVRVELNVRRSPEDDSALNSIAVLNVNKGHLMELRGKVQGDRLKILLDDGAGMSLINRKKVEQLNLPVFAAAHEIGLTGFQGKVAEVCSETTDISIEVTDQSGYTHKLGVIRALICDLGSYDMILGMPSHIAFDIRKNYRGQEFSILNDKNSRVQISCIKSGVVRDAWEKTSILPFITVAQVNKTLGLGQDLEAYIFL